MWYVATFWNCLSDSKFILFYLTLAVSFFEVVLLRMRGGEEVRRQGSSCAAAGGGSEAKVPDVNEAHCDVRKKQDPKKTQ